MHEAIEADVDIDDNDDNCDEDGDKCYTFFNSHVCLCVSLSVCAKTRIPWAVRLSWLLGHTALVFGLQ